MKKLLASVAMVLLLVGCASKYDDSALQTRVADLERRVNELEINVSALQTAVGDGVFVKKVQEYRDPDTQKIVGITVTFTNDEVKWFQIEPVQDYAGPVIGVIKSGTGALVWAVDGQAIEVNGAEVPVYQTPVFTIDEDGNLLVSIDGSDPVVLGQVQNEGATLQDGIFTNIEVTDDAIILTLSDDSTVSIPFAEAFKLTIEGNEFIFSDNGAITIPYSISARTEGTEVRVSGYSPMDFTVTVDEAQIEIKPLHEMAAAVMLVIADSNVGLVSTATLSVEPECCYVVNGSQFEEADFMADPDGDLIEANVISNIEFNVVPVDEWITVKEVKASAYTITLEVAANPGPEGRIGQVDLVKASDASAIVQSIFIGQEAPVAGPKDLGKKGSANSYIISAPGEYKFPAVKGNSDTSVGSIGSVAVLWATLNTDVAPEENALLSDVAYADGYISFTAPDPLVPGNVVIAAKNASGNILWSWHIWIPETAIETKNYGIYSADMMDRNLGALVAAAADAAAPVESFGLTYQWGRKDPFPGPKAVNSSSNAAVWGVELSVKPGSGTSAESLMESVDEAIANPTVMGFAQNGDWLPAEVADNNLWKNDAKTIYDPCPPGYRVPARDTESAFHSSDLSTATGWQDNAAMYWFALGDPLAIFPYAGYRDDYGPKSMTHAYDRGMYWTAYSSQAAKAYYVNVRTGSAHARAEAGKSRAGSVRCVVEATE